MGESQLKCFQMFSFQHILFSLLVCCTYHQLVLQCVPITLFSLQKCYSLVVDFLLMLMMSVHIEASCGGAVST